MYFMKKLKILTSHDSPSNSILAVQMTHESMHSKDVSLPLSLVCSIFRNVARRYQLTFALKYHLLDQFSIAHGEYDPPLSCHKQH